MLRSPRQRSPMHSARSTCSSSISSKRARRRPLTAMTALPSVQQLAAVDNIIDQAASTGFKPNLVLEPDLIAALKKRVGSKEVTHGSSPVGGGETKRRASFSGGFKDGSKSAGNFSARNISAGAQDHGGQMPLSFTGAASESQGRRHRKATTVDSGGHSPSSATGQAFPGLAIAPDDAYRLIPTDTVEEEREEELEEQKTKVAKKRNKGASSRMETLAAMPEWRIKGQEAIAGFCFQTLMALLIISNSLVIGLETDITTWKHWDTIENTFLFCFLGELILKSLFHGCDLFHRENPDLNWNVFDTFIVSLGLVDFIASLLTTSKGGSFATLFRIIRLLRILRIIRIVKFLKQLYLLALGLAEAAQAVFWVTILMTFILYVFSIVMVKTIGRPPDSDPNQDFLQRHFGGVLPSMLSLFVLMSSPNLPVYQDQLGLLEERPLFALFLVVFIVFGSFGMVALLTGVISESMFEKNNMRKEEERIEHEKLRLDVGLRCEELYETFEKNEEDEVDINDLKDEEAVNDMAKTFESAGVFVTTYDLCTMIEYLDVDGSGTINKDEFMRGMLVLAEGLRPISVQEVHHDVGVCRVKIERMEENITAMMKLLQGEGGNENGKERKDPATSVAASSELSKIILENLSEQLHDLTRGQQKIEKMCKNSQDMDGRVQEISRQVQRLLGDETASLKAYFNTSLQELGQQIVQQCFRERSHTSSRWSDSHFGAPLEAQSTVSMKKEPVPQPRRDSTWPSMSFSAAGSSAEQAGGGASSAAPEAGSPDSLRFFTFNPDQLMPPTRQQTQEPRGRPEVADAVLQAARRQSGHSVATASTAAATAASTSATASFANLPQAGEASTSTVTAGSAEVLDVQSSLANMRVQELISWQQRIQSELRRAGQQEGMTGIVQATQPASTLPGARLPQAAHAAQSQQDQQLHHFPSAPHQTQTPEAAQAASVQAMTMQAAPMQATNAKVSGAAPYSMQDLHAAQVLQALQSQTPVPSSSAVSATSGGEPARHASALDNTASLAELLNQVREIVSNHEALQRSSATASADGETSRSNEVLDCDDIQHLPN